MIIYIAGPITGVIDYKRKFEAAEKMLINMGHIAINPAYLPSGLKDYMPICKAMIDQADAVYFLTGWQQSKGAKEEYEYAQKKKKSMYFEEDFIKGNHDIPLKNTPDFIKKYLSYKNSTKPLII
ncbi:uncharacterized protein DUF4406 [Herbinix hemicellulosilytica]|uniref:DUF4406 domain-containing protein n=1 Tax=Herbinix hemicellulosilytica TaxID=1564487 RepID=A0A0H5SIK0_HERHM|nr:DUF4406 domain-containing protein [Herbinix hemicellulosilytica]RBP60921.1 uncharacterized protein DUF4406 [Herbinix hemicellulosilytica]CRZ34616.1 hypothetical protein HHT355_1415 [Herbinix hemicellulosilytica]